MAENLRIVMIGEMVVGDKPDDVLVAYGLGSCVAVCLYDPGRRAGGLLHALLPAAPDESRAREQPAKYVEEGVSLLIESLLKSGSRRQHLVARLCGGAQILSRPDLEATSGLRGHLAVGRLNVQAAEAALRAAGLRVQGRSTGGHTGRTVKLYLADGQVIVQTLKHGEQVLK